MNASITDAPMIALMATALRMPHEATDETKLKIAEALETLLRERDEARAAHKNASEYAMTGNEALHRALDLADVLFETLYRVTPAMRTDEDCQRALQPAIESRRLLGFLARDPEHLSAMLAATPYAPKEATT